MQHTRVTALPAAQRWRAAMLLVCRGVLQQACGAAGAGVRAIRDARLNTGHSRDHFMRTACSSPCPAHMQGYARRVAEEQLDPGQGFTVDLAIKDVR